MMAENPNWWSLNGSSSTPDDHLHNHAYPVPWTQLLVGRLQATDQEERLGNTSCDSNPDYRRKQLDQKSSINDDTDQIISYSRNYSNSVVFDDHHVKPEMKEQSISQQQQELYSTYNVTNHKEHDHPWSSCFTSENNHINYLDFSRDRKRNQHEALDQYTSLQCNDTLAPSGTSKKARVQPSSTQQPALKVRKEKLGDRNNSITPTSFPIWKGMYVSSENYDFNQLIMLMKPVKRKKQWGYIRFLEAQVQALSSAYSGNASTGSMRIQQSVNDELASGKDLRSRGLSLVPVELCPSC
ncbi:BHLH domain-containing protein [Heracleum sosnowskyi]|uniref:BHLH domain-containing protein n=1 Tax=Heracleum sosnowskyi TaxID=360622 RepID=A0AAD8M5I5_9APIA|nr:BHLH domain-containing protein [Heracleum sosnowskyi]